MQGLGFDPLITHEFVGSDPYPDSDVVFGVRTSCLGDYVRHEAGTVPEGRRLDPPFYPLDAGARARLAALARPRLDASGSLLVTSQAARTRARNLEGAHAKVEAIVRAALEPPRRRERTRAPARVAEARLTGKKHRAAARDRPASRRAPVRSIP